MAGLLAAADGTLRMPTMEASAVCPWRALVNPPRTAEALRIALEVAGRIRDPARVENAVVEAKLQSNLPKGPHWMAHGLAQGYAGLALLWGQLDRCFPGQGWDAAAHEHLEIAASGAATQPYIVASAFGGLGGLAFAAWYLSRGGTRYRGLVATLEHSLIAKLRLMIANASQQHHGVGVNTFDVISGLSGIALYLLCRRESAEVDAALAEVIGCLIELSREEEGLPRWHCPHRLLGPDDTMQRQYPHGNLNCGLAHGIPGPLGALALAHRAGVSCRGLSEAIDRLATWLLDHRLDDEWGINWPTAVGLLPPDSPGGRVAPASASPGGSSHAAWCYGSPGIARALYLAGLALQNSQYCRVALSAIEAVLRRPIPARRIDSPTFCHGVAGLLEVVLRFAHDTGSPTLLAGVEALTAQLISLHEPSSLLGFRSIEMNAKRVDQPGLLDGAPGCALVLLGVATDVEPAWDRLFLLS
jgi:lantibiotic modifying enzyme